jgi:two-component system phosphate regulon sensor histidine kinase PhoR
MYITLIFKAGLYYAVFKESLLVLPIAIGLYLVLLSMQEGLSIFSEYTMKPRLFMLLAIPAVTIYTAHVFEQRDRQLFQLNIRLRDQAGKLREQAREMAAMIESMHDGLLVIDARFQVVTLNPGSRTILDLHPGARLPIKLSRVEHGTEIRRIVEDALIDSKATGILEVLPPVSGENDEALRTYQAVASRVSDEAGAGNRVVLILRDITEQRQLENAKSNFLSVVSHELRTPLSSIKGFLKIILEGRAGGLNETQSDFINTAYGQAEYLNVLVNDLVEFTRMQVRHTDLDRGPVLLSNTVNSICNRLNPLVADKNLTLTTHFQPDLPEIEGDQLRLEQVVSNLLANAIKFTPEGGEIALSVRSEDDEVVVEVTDSGIGIPSDHLAKIFEPFYQVSDGPARLHGGMGLGLAICHHIVERHGGRMEVESMVGVGSTFRFALPAQRQGRHANKLDLVLR